MKQRKKKKKFEVRVRAGWQKMEIPIYARVAKIFQEWNKIPKRKILVGLSKIDIFTI